MLDANLEVIRLGFYPAAKHSAKVLLKRLAAWVVESLDLFDALAQFARVES